MLEETAPLPDTHLGREELEEVAKLFSVFAEATRLAILQALKQGPRCVTDLVSELGTTQANISKQLQVLHAANLLHREKRGTSVFYSINEEMIFPLCRMICDKLNRDRQGKKERFNF